MKIFMNRLMRNKRRGVITRRSSMNQGPPTPTHTLTGVLVKRTGPKGGVGSWPVPESSARKKHVQHCVFGELSWAVEVVFLFSLFFYKKISDFVFSVAVDI